MDDIPISKDFKDFEPFLVGNPKQFLIYLGSFYCVREECNNQCPYFEKGCENVEESIQRTVIPNARRGIGLEEEGFLVLRFKDSLTFKDVPKELWNTPFDDLCLDQANLHFLLMNFKKPFRVLKSQIRYYGSREEFNQSEYFKYFVVFSEYVPQHLIMAVDYSAIEPRVTTICSKEKEYIKVFEGFPKAVVREVQIKE